MRILDLKSETYARLIARKCAVDKSLKLYQDYEDDGDNEDIDDDDVATPMTRIEKLYLKEWHIIEENENLTDKSIVLRGNTFEYCEDFSYEGGGCLRLITRNEQLYHR